MSRFTLLVAAFGASTLVDSAAKGTVLLGLAAIAAVGLRRDSAATRHLVWLFAMVALLVVPAMSVMLPEWRVLPSWAGMMVASPGRSQTRPLTFPSDSEISTPAQIDSPSDDQTSDPSRAVPSVEPRDRRASSAHPTSTTQTRPGRQWLDRLPVLWALGFSLLILRLAIARWMLCRIERQAVDCRKSGNESQDPLVAALDMACSQMGIRRTVTLLTHPEKTIPLVWGIFRPRLMLPAAARQWSNDQLRSVLLHELAHLKRGDTIALLLTQLACAVHWFNPCVWAAAWRIGFERERACDDLVLAKGVRASAYASHLLEIVTGLSPSRWTQACGLAIVRKSSLEGRLIAVLNTHLNRRDLSAALLTGFLLIAVAVVVPVAMLRAADEQRIANSPQSATEPKAGSKLDSTIEERLQWGQPVNGLRAALITSPALGDRSADALGDRSADEHFDFKLVIQNVTQAPVRLNTSAAGSKRHWLLVSRDGEPLLATNDPQPADLDYRLEPGQVAVVRLFPPGRRRGANIAAGEPGMTFMGELKVENAVQGAWSGTVRTADTSGVFTAYGRLPKDKDARELYKRWNAIARGDEKIPGALIGLLAQSIQTFTINNPTWETTPQLLKMLPRLDASHDWAGPDALALLDELSALQNTPITMALHNEHTLHKGSPFPPELQDAAWGQAAENGLRLAFLFEPRAKEHRLGTVLKSRLLIHNSGTKAVVFRTGTWHQPRHTVRDARGNQIDVDAVDWETRSRLVPFRLGPNEYVELPTTGLGIGKDNNDDDVRNVQVGSWINAAAGDQITIATSQILLSDWTEKDSTDQVPQWWHDYVASRVARHLPLPAAAEERERILSRVAMELFMDPVGGKERGGFPTDAKPTAVNSLVDRLANSDRALAFVGSLQSSPTEFTVLPPDPDAAKRPRSANNPGRYTLSDRAVLLITRRPIDERIVNEASIQFHASDPKPAAQSEPYRLKLPDGYDTWAVAWVRGESLLWLQESDSFRSYNIADPAQVKEEVVDRKQVPLQIREALHRALTSLEPKAAPPVTKPQPAASRP